MRILWFSSAIECNSGYGVVTRELVSRLKKAGHFVRVATKHMYPVWNRWVNLLNIRSNYNNIKAALDENDTKKALETIERGYDELEGVEIFEGTNVAILNEMLRDERFDCVISLFDIWLLNKKTQPIHDSWISYTPIDTEWISDELAEVCTGTDIKDSEGKRGPSLHIALSRHGARELNSIGIVPLLAPHGVDTTLFRPKPEGRKAFRDDFGFGDDIFLIGSVGLNYGDDRKGFIPLMRAFKKFHEAHPEARLYIHSHAEGKYPGTVSYLRIVHKLGIEKWVCWPHQPSNDIGRIDGEWLVDTYNGMDVFCLPTRGEGFGLPIIEAQACGIPVITTNTTTGPELVGETGYLIEVNDSDLRYLPNNTFRHEVGEGPVLSCLNTAYNAWKYGDWENIKEKALKKGREYSWDNVWNIYWIPILKHLEERLRHGKQKA